MGSANHGRAFILPKIRISGRKEKTMMSINERLTAIKRAAEETDCPLIVTLAEGTGFHYELLSGDLSEAENREILTTIADLFSHGLYEDAISVLSLAFGLMGYDVASEVVSAVGACDDEHCMETFLARFLLECTDDLKAIYE